MSILFEWYENPMAPHQEGKKPARHPRIMFNGITNTRKITRIIEARSTVHAADIAAVLTSLSEVISEEIGEGRRVHLDGIGSFYPTLTTTEEVNDETKVPTRKVTLKGIKFLPEKSLRNAIEIYGFTHVKGARHSSKLTDAEIDARVEAFFGSNDVMRRRDFQEICNLNQSTANVRLRQLREEGKLKNVGLPKQPLYVPAPGHYGKAAEKTDE